MSSEKPTPFFKAEKSSREDLKNDASKDPDLVKSNERLQDAMQGKQGLR